jgi:hypothetical protein
VTTVTPEANWAIALRNAVVSTIVMINSEGIGD